MHGILERQLVSGEQRARWERGGGLALVVVQEAREELRRRLVVAQVRRGTPAYAAGLNVDDEILAFDELRVRADRLDNRLEQYRAGDTVSLLIARREQLLRLEVTLGSEPARQWRLEMAPGATDTQNRQLSQWLNA
jgi:predicted metalloprotease with PDZ domain